MLLNIYYMIKIKNLSFFLLKSLYNILYCAHSEMI